MGFQYFPTLIFPIMLFFHLYFDKFRRFFCFSCLDFGFCCLRNFFLLLLYRFRHNNLFFRFFLYRWRGLRNRRLAFSHLYFSIFSDPDSDHFLFFSGFAFQPRNLFRRNSSRQLIICFLLSFEHKRHRLIFPFIYIFQMYFQSDPLTFPGCLYISSAFLSFFL